MNEPDLHDLARDVPDRLTVPYRPVDDIIARGTTLRRRRRALRAAGITSLTVAVGLVGFVGVSDDEPDVRSGAAREAPTSQVPFPTPEGLLFVPPACEGPDEEPLTAREVDPAMRTLPTWLPPGFGVLDISATRYNPCSFLSPVLVLARFEGDTVTSTISVIGPYQPPHAVPSEPTPLRGTEGWRWEGVRDSAGLHFGWVEPGGGLWTVTGQASRCSWGPRRSRLRPASPPTPCPMATRFSGRHLALATWRTGPPPRSGRSSPVWNLGSREATTTRSAAPASGRAGASLSRR
jgi:hypothetical protein